MDLYELPPKIDNPHWPMPPGYGDADKVEQRDMRLELCRGWYDPNDAQRLMRRDRPDIFVTALKFFVDFHIKLADCCRSAYFWPDPEYKDKIRRMFCYPRSGLVAPRGGSKTFTVVLELIPFLAITRPETEVLIGSETGDLTNEKIKLIRKRIESNGRIFGDFGVVWSQGRSAREWTNRCLDFANGSSITGSSIDMSTRGRHPDAGVIDDAEGKRSKNAKWRAQYLEWLFHDYLNQFRDDGAHVMKIGTILRDDSVLWRVIHNIDTDNRFANWKRDIIKMIETDDETGVQHSNWPAYLSLENFKAKIKGDTEVGTAVTVIGEAAMMAEFQGEPIPVGDRMFIRQERLHGYIMWMDAGGKRSLYDPNTKETRYLDDMVEDFRVLGGVDPSENEGHGDPCGIVIGIFDPDGILWVIDAWTDKCFSDVVIDQSLRLSWEWKVERLAWEANALQKTIYRNAVKKRAEAEERGWHVPMFHPLKNESVPKAERIERMRPDFAAGLIKLPLFHPLDGYDPIPHPHGKALRTLIRQFDHFTSDHTGHDDLIDACERMHRMCVAPPRSSPFVPRQTRALQRCEDHGFQVNPMEADPQWWTKGMKDRFEKSTGLAALAAVGSCDMFE